MIILEHLNNKGDKNIENKVQKILRKMNCAIFIVGVLLVTHSFQLIEAKRYTSGGRKTTSSGGGYNTHRQSSSNSGPVAVPSNSRSDMTRLSYPSNNAQPHATGGVGGQSAPGIGWNVPKQQGPPPAYSASNPAGGARTNVHEAPPSYHGNAAPPSYGAAMGGSNVHSPITATKTQGVQSSYPVQSMPAGATYHSPGALPAGATYYPGGHAPAGGSYYPGGHAPAGGSYYPSSGQYPAGGGYYPAAGGHMPAGATYIPAGAAMPPGATYYSQPPSSSSGLGFGSGLAAGAIGGALLGHALTPTHTRVVESAPAGGGSGGEDKIIIINNGPPGSVTTTDAGSGTTVINAGGAANPAGGAANPAVAVPPMTADASAPLAPMIPVAGENATSTGDAAAIPQPPQMAQPPNADQPPAGGIICVPMRVNETDPNDSEKMIEVEKVACYPAPPPAPPAAAAATDPQQAAVNASPGDTSAPLAPMNPVLLPEESAMRKSNAMSQQSMGFSGLLMSAWFCIFVASRLNQ